MAELREQYKASATPSRLALRILDCPPAQCATPTGVPLSRGRMTVGHLYA
ncbi:hypothetical protein ACN265_21445 [Micromonospora sp. WMMD730]